MRGSEVRVDGALVGVDDVGGFERVAIVEGETVAEGEAVGEAVFVDRPVLGEIRDQTQLDVELDKAGEHVRNQLAGHDPEVDLGRVEIRNLANAEAELERAASLRFSLG